MLKYLYDRDKLVADFAARMIPHAYARGFGNCRAIGVVDEHNELIAGMVYHHISPEAGVMEISVAALPGRQWLSRATLAVMYEFPFRQCGCQLLLHTIEVGNIRALRQLLAIGCKRIDFPRLFGRGRDAVVCTLTREAWESNKLCQRFWRHRQHRVAA
jgi:RimJ/RimL family protein N-acetyltransferase